jgi:short-subunit dehydrogenase
MQQVNQRKKAIIIGATSGIGRALAIELLAKNYVVGVTGRRLEHLLELQQQNPDRIFINQFDITNVESIAPALDTLSQHLGGIDVLILSSGYGDINENLLSKIEFDTINTNVSGFTSIAIWTYAYFTKQGFGHFTAITSIAGLRGGKAAPSYNASKAYQINYLEALRQKANTDNLKIYITDIRPGFVDTAMAKGDKKFWVASPITAAKQILAAIEQKKSIAYVSKRWLIIAVLLKLMPNSIYKKL